MPNAIAEFRTRDYACPLVDRRVSIESEYRVRFANDGSELSRVRFRWECSDRDACPVAKRHEKGAGTTYDWSVCAFKKADEAAR